MNKNKNNYKIIFKSNRQKKKSDSTLMSLC